MTQQIAAPAGGLRERKKQRTREELVEAAIGLFLDQGFEHTTVDQIAAAVDVSQRTFFRYFASKEDVAFGAVSAVEEMFGRLLREQPPQVPPLEAMRRTMHDVWREMRRPGTPVVDVGLHLRMVRLIDSTPALLAAHLRRTEAVEERFAADLARREGVDVDDDPRPRLLSAVFGAVVRIANRAWSVRGETDLDAMSATMERYLDHLQPALAGHWHREPPARTAPGQPGQPLGGPA